ncbi:MAG: hypothetical protein KJ069_17000 [Anaerolineae bacterium]|nr:hypothetical protein [Anaerolineae bacterium]
MPFWRTVDTSRTLATRYSSCLNSKRPLPEPVYTHLRNYTRCWLTNRLPESGADFSHRSGYGSYRLQVTEEGDGVTAVGETSEATAV